MADRASSEREGGARWLNITDAAAYLGVSTKTIRRWIHAGAIHSELRPGRTRPQYVVPLADLDARRPDRHAAHADVVDLVKHQLISWDEALAAHLAAGESRLARVEDELQRLNAMIRRREREPHTAHAVRSTARSSDGHGGAVARVLSELRDGITELQAQLAALTEDPGEPVAPSTSALSQQVERLATLADQLAEDQVPSS